MHEACSRHETRSVRRAPDQDLTGSVWSECLRDKSRQFLYSTIGDATKTTRRIRPSAPPTVTRIVYLPDLSAHFAFKDGAAVRPLFRIARAASACRPPKNVLPMVRRRAPRGTRPPPRGTGGRAGSSRPRAGGAESDRPGVVWPSRSRPASPPFANSQPAKAPRRSPKSQRNFSEYCASRRRRPKPEA